MQDAKSRLQAKYCSNALVVGYGLFEGSEEGISAGGLGGIQVGDIFVNMSMLRREDLREMCRETSFSSFGEQMRQERIFHSSKAEKITLDKVLELHSLAVLAIGSAGIGKTTAFCSKLPYDWSKGRLLQDVDLLLCFELRDEEVLKFRSTEELLCAALDLSADEDRRAVLDYVRNNAHRVCIVLDGVDECNMAKCSMYMKRLLQGIAPRLQGLRTVLTSRPCQRIFELSQVGQIDRSYVEVTGFSSPDIDTYIRQVLPGEEGERMIKEIEDHGDVKSLLSTPFIAALSCVQYHNECTISKCATTVLEKMLVRLLGKQNRVSCSRYRELPGCAGDVLNELSAFAFKHFVKRKFLLDEYDVHKSKLSERCLKLGVLVACDKTLPYARIGQYRFSHLVLQEHLAAYHATSKLVKSERDVKELMYLIGIKDMKTWTFWKFTIAFMRGALTTAAFLHMKDVYLGDLTYSLKNMLSLLRKGDDDLAASSRPPSSLYDWDDHLFPDIARMLCSCLQHHELRVLANDLLEDECGADMGNCVVDSLLPEDREPTDELYLETLLSVWKDNVPLANGPMLFRYVCKVKSDLVFNKHVKQLLMPSDDSSVDPQPMFPAIAASQGVNDSSVEPQPKQPAIAAPQAVGASASLTGDFSNVLSLFISLLEMAFPLFYEYVQYHNETSPDADREPPEMELGEVYYMPLSPASFYRVVTVLRAREGKKMRSLQLYESPHVHAGDLREESVAAFLQVASRLLRIRMLSFPFLSTESHAAGLSTVLSAHHESMVTLAIAGSQSLDVLPLLEGLAECARIESLSMTSLRISLDSAQMFSALLAMSSLPSLQELRLGGCHVGDEGFAMLAQGCCSCQDLQVISMTDNDLSRSSVVPLRQMLQSCAKLVTVSLHHNPAMFLHGGPSVDNGDLQQSDAQAFADTVKTAAFKLQGLYLYDGTPQTDDNLYTLLCDACANAVNDKGQRRRIQGPVAKSALSDLVPRLQQFVQSSVEG